MSPAFSSVRQAAGFALLLLLLLILPLAVGKKLLPPREQIYSSLGWANGGWGYFHQQIFEEKTPIDIAFIGPSHIWYAVDDRYVQAKLSEQLGRPAAVRSFCWGTSGFDTIYFVAKDLLEHRKVRLLVFYDDTPESTIPHGRMTRLFRFAEDRQDTAGLPWNYQANYYLAAVLGMPRNLLDWIRPNLPINLEKNNAFISIGAETEDLVERLGSLGVRAGFAPEEFSDHRAYQEFHPPISDQPNEVGIYPNVLPQDFQFVDEAIPSLQMHFIKKLVALSHDHQTSLLLVNPPVFANRRDSVVMEGKPWLILVPDLTIVGIPPAKIYGDMSDSEIEKLYADKFHMNVNGQQYFTSIITPALLHAYAEKVSP